MKYIIASNAYLFSNRFQPFETHTTRQGNYRKPKRFFGQYLVLGVGTHVSSRGT